MLLKPRSQINSERFPVPRSITLIWNSAGWLGENQLYKSPQTECTDGWKTEWNGGRNLDCVRGIWPQMQSLLRVPAHSKLLDLSPRQLKKKSLFRFSTQPPWAWKCTLPLVLPLCVKSRMLNSTDEWRKNKHLSNQLQKNQINWDMLALTTIYFSQQRSCLLCPGRKLRTVT